MPEPIDAPEHWRTAALHPARAFGAPPVTGRLRASPEDFEVEEELGFEPDGEGQHLLLRVRKRGANTEWVARVLARHARSRVHEIGFAGLKDRQAVAVQWFSVPRNAATPESWLSFQNEELSVVEVRPHGRKLRRGALAANRFRIRVRDLNGDVESLEARLALIRARGVPNYFGYQRFGIDGSNLGMLCRWAVGGGELPKRSRRGFTLSAGRSLLFNAVLAERIRLGHWDRLLAGDLANLDGSASIFVVDAPDPELAARCARFDIHPTGPLWGRAGLRARHEAEILERQVIGRFEPVAAALEGAGLEQERRSLRLKVEALEARPGGDLEVTFRLAAGGFATSVLRELIDY